MGSFFRKINLSDDWKILRMERGAPVAGCQPRNVINVINFLTSQWFLGKSNDGIFLSEPLPEFICDTRDSELTATSPPMMFLTWDFEKWACYFRFWLTPGRSVLTYLYWSESPSPVCFWSKKPSRPEPVSIPIPVKLGSFLGFLDKSEALTESSDQSEAQHPDGITGSFRI